jgi:hypothetical protein
MTKDDQRRAPVNRKLPNEKSIQKKYRQTANGMRKHDHDHRITTMKSSHKMLNDSSNIFVVQWEF